MSIDGLLTRNNYNVFCKSLTTNELTLADSIKGTLLVSDGTKFNKLPPGADDLLLTTDSTAPLGYRFASTTPGSGDVDGPALGTATDNAIVRWDGGSGRQIQNSNAILDDAGLLTATGLNLVGSVAEDLLVHNGTSYVRKGVGTEGQVLSVSSGIVDWGTLPPPVPWQDGADAVTFARIGTTAVAASADQVAILGSTTGIDGISVGPRSIASNQYTVAIGPDAKAQGSFGTAIGYLSDALLTGDTAYGFNAKAQGQNSTAVGTASQATELDAVALGAGAVASGQFSTALGSGCTSTGFQAVSIGDANATGSNSIAIGENAIASLADAIALGAGSTTTVAGQLSFNAAATQSTVGAAGGASALPATPALYWRVRIGEVNYVLPLYLEA